MSNAKRILLAVDDSKATDRAVRYTAEVIAGRKDFEIHLLHVLDELPPDMPELGLSKTEYDEVKGHEVEKQWERVESRAAQPVFDRARKVLAGMDIAADRIETHCYYVNGSENIAEDILKTARDRGCGTVVVGKQALPWRQELLHKHTAPELVKSGRGVALWIVE